MSYSLFALTTFHADGTDSLTSPAYARFHCFGLSFFAKCRRHTSKLKWKAECQTGTYFID